MKRKKDLRSKATVRMLAAGMILMLLAAALCSAAAEGMTLEPWTCESGWVSFPLEAQKDELTEVWNEGAKTFGELIGLPGLEGPMLRSMLLQGYAYETHFDNLSIDGARVTVTSKDGEEMFSHEYAWIETLENAMQGAAVHVFQAGEKAGEFNYLCMTEPKETTGENGSYITFNLFHAASDYRKTFEIKDGESVQIPCMMIRKDAGIEGLTAAIMDIFTSPAIITRK